MYVTNICPTIGKLTMATITAEKTTCKFNSCNGNGVTENIDREVRQDPY